MIEAAGNPNSVDGAVRLCGPGAHIAFIGIPTADLTLELKTFQHLLRQGAVAARVVEFVRRPFPGDQWTVTLDKLASGDLKWEFMISHDLDLAELPATFERFEDRDFHFSKVMFRP